MRNNNTRAGWSLAPLLLLIAVSGDAAGTRSDLRQLPRDEWPVYGGDYNNSRYSQLKEIDASNVAKIGGAWVMKFDAESSTATPIVQDGVMYITAGVHVYALDAATGEKRWTYKSDVALSPRAVTLGEGRVFVGTRAARILAIEQKTGALAWSTMIGDEPAFPGQGISGAPVYVDGLVIAGVANGDFGLRGRMVAVDSKTGKQVWRFDTIPGPGEFGHDTWPQDNDVWKKGGGGVWMAPAVDPDLGMVYVGVGNAVPQWAGESRPGDNLFTGSVLALDIKTGKRRWHYQLVHHEVWDHDLGTPVVLYDATVDGKRRKALAAMRTDGYLFLLDRKTGQPVFPTQERAVPQNAWMKTAPTQPFPVNADAMGPRCVEEDTVPPGFDRDCYFDPVDERPNIMALVLTARSAPMSYNPQTGYFYATGSIAPFWVRHSKDNPYLFYYTGIVPGMKQYGLLAAFDSRTNKILWQHRLPYKIGNGSGVLTTAGGVLLHAHPDGNLYAYNAKSGEELFKFQLGASADGPVMSYQQQGTQYLALTTRDSLWTFKLGGTIQPRPQLPQPSTVTSFVGLIEDADHVGMGSTIRDGGLNGKHEEPDPYGLRPQRVRIEAGKPITWTNNTDMPHSARARDGSWQTGEIKPGASASVTFAKPGTYVYICSEHPWTYGEITVE